MLEFRSTTYVAGHSSSAWCAGMAFKTDVYEVGGHMIWGATARILGRLLLRPG